MPKAQCRVCETGTAFYIDLVVSRKGKGARQWRLRICVDCWRAWEAMLDQGAVGVQRGLEEARSGGPVWFL